MVSVSALLALAAVAYLLGAVPFALLLGLMRGIDIRRQGSGNVGATNLGRVLGRRWGMVAFVLDFLKGFLPVMLVHALAVEEGAASSGRGILVPHAQMVCALAAILGHVFPVYLRFRGGKGVATSFGALAGLAWPAAMAAAVVWLAVFLITRTVSLASISAALAFPAVTFLVFRGAPAQVAVPMNLLALLMGALILFRHRSNIRRLRAGEEGRF